VAQQVQVVLIDDIDGSEATETVEFGLDGVNYTIDLSAENAQALRDALAPYLGHATKATRRRAARAGATRAAAPARSRAGSTAAIREWARSQGMEISDRGRIPNAVREQYEAATA
jgi:hypothetical protein